MERGVGAAAAALYALAVLLSPLVASLPTVDGLGHAHVLAHAEHSHEPDAAQAEAPDLSPSAGADAHTPPAPDDRDAEPGQGSDHQHFSATAGLLVALATLAQPSHSAVVVTAPQHRAAPSRAQPPPDRPPHLDILAV